MLFKKKKDLLGVDIGSSAVKVVQLRESRGLYHLKKVGFALLPHDAIVDNSIMDSTAVVEVLRNLVQELKIGTKSVATSISGHSVIIRKIQLPVMTEEELEWSIQFEAEQYIPFEISEVNLDFQILGPDSGDPTQMNVILVAAKKDFVNDHIAIFRECGLTPEVMDVDCFAVQNAFELSYGVAGEEIVALINLGASAINVNVLKGGASVFTRDIQVGGGMFNEEIQKQLGLSTEAAERAKIAGGGEGVDVATLREIMEGAADNLAQEIQRSLDFFSATSADEKVQKIILTGGCSKVENIRTVLATRLGVDVDVMNPFRLVQVNGKDFDADYLESVGPMFSVAVGLAMRRMGDK